MSPGSPVAESRETSHGFVCHVRGQYGRDRVVVSCRLFGRPEHRGVDMSIATPTVASQQSLSPPAARRTESAEVWPQGRWQPRSSATMVVSTSDPRAVDTPDAGLAPPDALLVRLAELAPGAAGRVVVRARAIEWYLPIAVYLARRFAGRGEPLADLTQVAVIGLIKAVDRFDANRGVAFASYAMPTILGEIKRHFRDTAWTVRVPRRLQELTLQLSTVTEDLAHVLHRPPTTAELAARLGVSQRDVLAARRCAYAYRPLSFEQPAPDSEGLRLIDSLGGPDPGIDAVDNRDALRLRQRLAELPERDRRIIALRFYAEMSQAQIAAAIGVSQMHVSRLLARSLTRLREAMLADADGKAAAAGPTVVLQPEQLTGRLDATRLTARGRR
jgi:RNA polymerase sigma-B factor